MQQNFVRNSFSDENFRRYMYQKIVLVTKFFVYVPENSFCDEKFRH